MTPTEVTNVNEALALGDIDKAVAVLADKVDVRTAELPKLEKATSAVLARALAADPQTQTRLAAAFFHPNISVRRFARKLAQTLKDAAGPLGAPLLAALDSYIRTATIMPRSFEGTPAITKQRNEQAELVGNVVELLFKIAPGGLIGLIETYSPAWASRSSAIQTDAKANHAAWTQFGEFYRTKKEALWGANMAALGITSDQVPGSLEDAWTAELEADPDVISYRATLKPMWAIPETVATTILDEGSVFRDTFTTPFYQLSTNTDYLAGVGAQIGTKLWELAERAVSGDNVASDALDVLHPMCRPELATVYMGHEAVVDRLTRLLGGAINGEFVNSPAWVYLARCLAHSLSLYLSPANASPLPAHVNAAAIAALKTPKMGFDRLFAPLEAELNRREPQTASVPINTKTAEAPSGSSGEPHSGLAGILARMRLDENSFDRRWDDVRAKVAAIADTLTTVEARADALIVPPKVTWEKLRGRMIEDNVDRDNLIAQWNKSPSWPDERAALAAVVGPRIIEAIRSKSAQWHRAKIGRSEIGPHPDPVKWELMDKKERKNWTDNQRYEQHSALYNEINDLTRIFLAICGMERCLETIDALPGPDLIALRVMNENRMLERWEKAFTQPGDPFEPPTPSMLPIVREVYARRLADDHGSEDRQEPAYRIHRYASILYQIGGDDAAGEARDLIASGQTNLCYSCAIGATAASRRDFDFIVPLAAHTRAGSAEKPLHELMDALASENPTKYRQTAVALIHQLASVTDKDQPAIHFELLDAISRASPIYTENVDTVAMGLESTLPEVVKWAMTTLTELVRYNAEWSTISQRAGEKLWADQPGMVKEAARFLGVVGVSRVEARDIAVDVLGDALALESAAIQEAILKALSAIKAKDSLLSLPCGPRIKELAAAQPDRFGKFAAKLA